MAAIDVGSGASSRANSFAPGNTIIDANNPADGTGTLTSLEVYCWSGYDLTNTDMATFYIVSGSNFTTRGNVAIGTVTGGSKQVFDISATPIDVTETDYLGIYYSGGYLYAATSGGAGGWYEGGDRIPCTNYTFTGTIGGYFISIYGTGATGGAPPAGWTNIAKVNGVAAAAFAKVNGVAVADIAKFNGVAV